MKHAFLIMTTSIDNKLENLVQQLDSLNHDFFIHVDLKAGPISENHLKSILKFSRVTFVKRIKVTWGGFSMIKAELILMKAASDQHKYVYYHLLSGEDFPLKSNQALDDFFEQNKGKNFLEANHRIEKGNPDRFHLRFEQYHLLQDRFIGKKRNIFKYIDFLSCYLQRYIGIHRSKKIKILSGANWFSITDELVHYIRDHEQWINKHFKYTYCCDEVFIQSLVSDTPFMDTLSTNLRYVEFIWKSKHNATPRYITHNDLKLVDNPNYFFARKFKASTMKIFRERIQEEAAQDDNSAQILNTSYK